MSEATVQDFMLGLDLDKPVICRAVPGCGSVATWRATTLCPVRRDVVLTCGLHRREAEEAIDQIVGSGGGIECDEHAVSVPTPFIVWRSL